MSDTKKVFDYIEVEVEKLRKENALLKESHGELLDALQDAANCPYWSRNYGNHFTGLIEASKTLQKKLFYKSLPFKDEPRGEPNE